MAPRQKTTSVALGDLALEALRELAQEDTLAMRQNGETTSIYASDLIREAVEEYLKRRGYDFSIGVNRGGYRGGEKADEDLHPDTE